MMCVRERERERERERARERDLLYYKANNLVIINHESIFRVLLLYLT